MPQFLGDILASMSPVSVAFILAIVALWGVFNLRYGPRVVELGPTILTTIGIFGTFLGVALGLAHFDTTNVQASVPSLLAGLKTAFWASVFGVGAAVQIKLREFLLGSGAAQAGEAEDAISVLSDIRHALAGPGEASLLSQMKLARQDTNDRLLSQIRMARTDANERLDALRTAQEQGNQSLVALRTAQTEALQSLATQASETLVEALGQVVLDFNHKVAAQFGDNYRDLNEAVVRLLAWQESYKASIEAMSGRLDDTVRVMGYAASDLQKVGEASARINATAERVGHTLDGVHASERRLADMVGHVAALTEAASGRIPFVEARLGELVSQLANAVRAGQVALNQSLTENAAAMRAALEASQQDMSKANADLSRQTIDLVRKTQEQLAQLDREISADLSRAVGKLGGQLKTLSAQFAAGQEEPPKIALVAG